MTVLEPWSLIRNAAYLDIRQQPLFSPTECDRILSLLGGSWDNAGISGPIDGPRHGVDTDIRSVISQPLVSDASGWPMNALTEALTAVNDEVFRFDIRGIIAGDAPIVLKYEADTNDHYRPHRDSGGFHSFRKLTVIVQLSDPTGYVGGDLVLTENAQAASREQGTMIVFPAFLTHVVTPVVRGTRHCIVSWLHGPTFR